MPQKLTRKEFADELRAEYPDASKLTDDELVEIGIEDDPDLGNYVESMQEQFSREARSLDPAGMNAFRPPSLDLQRSPIPSPNDALISGLESRAPAPIKAANKYIRPLIGGMSEALPGGGGATEGIHSEDSQTMRTVGNLVGGVGATLAAAATMGVPGLVGMGGAQGATFANRANLAKEEAKKQAEGAKIDAAGGEYRYTEPTVMDTLADSKSVLRLGLQTGAGAGLNAIAPVLAPAKGPVVNALLGGTVNAVGNTVPIAIDQAIDQQKIDPTDPAYAGQYRLAATVGAAGGAVGGAVGARRGATTSPTDTPPAQGKVFYDEGEPRPGAPPPKPGQGREWAGDPGHKTDDGWVTVGAHMEVVTDNGPAAIRQVKVARGPDGNAVVIVRLHDDGTELVFNQAFQMKNTHTGQVHEIPLNRPVYRGSPPADGPMDPSDYNKPFGPKPQLKLQAENMVPVEQAPPVVPPVVPDAPLPMTPTPAAAAATGDPWNVAAPEYDAFKEFWGDGLLDPEIQAALKSGPIDEAKALELLRLVDQKFPVHTPAVERAAAVQPTADGTTPVPLHNRRASDQGFTPEVQRTMMNELFNDPEAREGGRNMMRRVGDINANRSYRSDSVSERESWIDDLRSAKLEEEPGQVPGMAPPVVEAAKQAIQVWRGIRGEGFDPRVPRDGYISTYTSSKAMADTYAGDDGQTLPFTIEGKEVIEFPTKLDRDGHPVLDKIGFDQRARQLGPNQVLVARNVTDTGPWASLARDPERKWSYGADVYAATGPDGIVAGHVPTGDPPPTQVTPEPVDFRLNEASRLREMMKKPAGADTSVRDTLSIRGKSVKDIEALVKQYGFTATKITPDGDGRWAVEVSGNDRTQLDLLTQATDSETGSAQVDLLAHTAGAIGGGLAGGAAGATEEDGFNWPMALIGAGVGLSGTLSFREYFRRIGKEHDVIKGLSTHPSINTAYERQYPKESKIGKDFRAAMTSAYEDLLDNTFTPHALLKREAEQWSRNNVGGAGDTTYFNLGIQALNDLTDAKFAIPPAAADKFKTLIADVVKDDDNYERALRIILLRSDIEKRQNDLARRTEAFGWLNAYTAAKRAGDFATAAQMRAQLRANPGILRKVDPLMRGGVPPEEAINTLHALETEAAEKHPDVLQAAENWRQWGRGLLEAQKAEGIEVSDSVQNMNRNYFPVYDLDKQSGDKISVGGPAGIGKSRSGYLKRRDRQKVEQRIWTDLVGPFFKRSIDQDVDLAKHRAATTILNHYDPYKNGTLPATQMVMGLDAQGRPTQMLAPTASIKPNGDYSHWEWSVPGEAGTKHGKIGGWLPTPLAAEIQRHFVPAPMWKQWIDKGNAGLKGLLIRGSGGGFLLTNILGNTADMHSSVPVTQWPMLGVAGLKSVASTLLEAASSSLEGTRFELNPQAQALADISQQGREAHIGTQAAAAEVTSQAIADPRIARKAIDPNTSKMVRATTAAQKPVRSYGRMFDKIREINENVTRLAHFIHLTQNNGVDAAQAGRIVNTVQGNYNPTNFTAAEQDLKRLVPFYAFYKNVANNWFPLVSREMAYGDTITEGRTAGVKPWMKKVAGGAAVAAAASVWNHLFFPDAEASLTDFQKEQFHILTPDLTDPWDEEGQRWNLVYRGWATPQNIASKMVGIGGAQNRLLHAAEGTGSGDELDRSWEQIKQTWSGMLHPVVGVAAAILGGGVDPITGQPVVEPGASGWRAAMQMASYPFEGLPGIRQMKQASREAAEPNETPARFIRRMLLGSINQPINRENQEIRALARAVAGGTRSATETRQSNREAALFNGEQKAWTPEEINNILTGQDKVSWQGKVVRLSELPKMLQKSKDKAPDDPGAVAAMQEAGKTGTIEPRKSGPVMIPTRDYIRALGPDVVLREFIKTFEGDQSQGDAWRSAAVTLVQQLRNESKNWEIPASLMMMLQQSPSAPANTEILGRVSALENQMAPEKQLGDRLGRKFFQ